MLILVDFDTLTISLYRLDIVTLFLYGSNDTIF